MTEDGKFVIDCVAHAFDNTARNAKGGAYARGIVESNFAFQWNLIPEQYRLDRRRYHQAFSADVLEEVLFVESGTDVAFYHIIPTWGVFEHLSPVEPALEVRARHPHRLYLYGGVSPLEGPKALDDLERQVEEWDIRALKLYPVDLINGKMELYGMNDEKITYPVLERCRDLGIKVIAIHKALPLGTAPMDAFRNDDVDYAARDFPDLAFEVVHGGFTFLEEMAFQVARFDNIYVNLEATAQLAIMRPAVFARILGELLAFGGAKKIFWGTGGPGASHPAPVLEAFTRFQIPPELREQYGYPELTGEMKQDILANNFAAIQDLDLQELKAATADDELAHRRREWDGTPWRALPTPEVPDPLATGEPMAAGSFGG